MKLPRHVAILLLGASLFGCAQQAVEPKPFQPAKVYGEWRIRVKPGQDEKFSRLVNEQGLPVYRAAGGTMIGWWKTLVGGSSYEHTAIWEFDSVSAFESSMKSLQNNEAIARYDSARALLIDGDNSRLLNLAPGANKPDIPISANFVVHEIHRVPFAEQTAYFSYLTQEGIPALEKQGFRPVGPFVANVGKWTEVTILLLFESLAEREMCIAKLMAHPDGGVFWEAMQQHFGELENRLLVPVRVTE